MNNLIDPSAKIGRNVTIGHGTRIYANVEIGDGCTIGDFCVIGHPGPGDNGPLVLGTGATVRSHAVLYEGSTIGPMLETGRNVSTTLRQWHLDFRLDFPPFALVG